MSDLERDLRRGELNIEGLGKRYWFRSDAGEFDSTNVLGEADPDSDGEQDVFAFFRGQRREIWALRDITCHVEPGERVAIVGANGAGKSTLIRILSNLLPPSEGKAEGAGLVLPFAALRSPLSPHDSGCDNLRMLARLLGIPLDRLEERLPQIIDFSELGSLAHERVTRYSDQSFGRLAMAMGLLIDADIYLVDDSVKVGDELYRNKFQEKFAELLTKPVTLIFASNALEQLRSYCRRALWLDRGKLVADGEVNAIISRFLSKDEEAIDFKELTAPDAPGDAAENRENTVPSDGRDTTTTKPATEELPERTGKPMPVAPVIVPAHRLQPMTDWLALVTRAENSWQRVLTRWREKTGHHEQHPIRSLDRSQPCTLAVIRSLCPMSMQGKPIRTALPGEALLVELLIETFQPNVTVAVRLELDAPPTIIFAAEPLVPLTASDPGQYLFRAEIDGDLMAYSFEAAAYKLRTRILLTKADADLKEMMIATIHLKLRGDLRYAFDDWRVTHGEPVTSIVNPAGAFIGARDNIEDADAMNARSSMTTWEKLNRRPLLRPRLKWMIYRVSPESVSVGGAKRIQTGLERVS